MRRGLQERLADVQALLRAARQVAKKSDGIAASIAQASGLSLEGVQLGFDRHLELDPTESDLATLLRQTPQTTRVHVILSSNVFVAALRALAIARAAAPVVTVRPSRRDPFLARALVDVASDPRLAIVDEAAIESGEIHVYGRDSTIEAVRNAAGRGVHVRGHGAGFGVSCLSSRVDVRQAARALAPDVVAFDQRGCLSPRIVFVEGDARTAVAFATELDAALTEWERRVPRGRLDSDEQSAAVRYGETLAFAGTLFARPGHMIGVSWEDAVMLPPTGRHVHVVPVANPVALGALLAPFAHAVVAVGTDDEARFCDAIPRHARVSRLGEMQRPSLDGPVDRRGRMKS